MSEYIFARKVVTITCSPSFANDLMNAESKYVTINGIIYKCHDIDKNGSFTIGLPSYPLHINTGKKKAQWKVEKNKYGKKGRK